MYDSYCNKRKKKKKKLARQVTGKPSRYYNLAHDLIFLSVILQELQELSIIFLEERIRKYNLNTQYF